MRLLTNFIFMKRILLIFTAFLFSLPFYATSPQTPDGSIPISIEKTRTSIRPHRAPSINELTFEGILYPAIGNLFITASSVCDVTVEVLNLTFFGEGR